MVKILDLRQLGSCGELLFPCTFQSDGREELSKGKKKWESEFIIIIHLQYLCLNICFVGVPNMMECVLNTLFSIKNVKMQDGC